jgi:hypothetical protein
MTSTKQIEANKKNAQKGGVKTEEGKGIVKYNALKHGLLAKEVVITAGEGVESQEEFNGLLDDLLGQLQVVGPVEEMLAEKIAIAYWRLRRAYRYEVGLIRHELDNATDNFYKEVYTDQQIDQKNQEERDSVEAWKQEKRELLKKQKAGKPLDATFEQTDVWEWYEDSISHLLPRTAENDQLPMSEEEIRKHLNENVCWDDDYLWGKLIGTCEKHITEHLQEIEKYTKQKMVNKRKLDVTKRLGNIPAKEELDRLLRYEGAIERQLYKAMNQLERVQRLRLGDHVPAPIEVDVDVNTDQTRSGSGFVS